MWMLRGEPSVAVRFASPDTVEVIRVEGETVYGAIAPLSEVKMVLTAERDAKGGVKFLSPSEVGIVEVAASEPFVAPTPPVLAEPPPVVRAGKKGRKQRTQEQIQAAHGYGFEDAGRFRYFVSEYHIQKANEYGPGGVEGASPDGIYTGTCDRCGTAIMNIYVFTDGVGFMHVGIDCAMIMGVPPEELKKAKQAHYSTLRDTRAKQREARYAKIRETREQEEARMEREAREAAPDLFSRIDALLAHPQASKRAKDAAGAYARYLVLHPEDIFNTSWLAEFVRYEMEAGLAANSDYVGKEGEAITLNLMAHRDRYRFDSPYGGGNINFLTDGRNIFILKSSTYGFDTGDRVAGTFTIKAHTLRDGVRQTELARPRKTKIMRNGEEEKGEP